MVFAVYNQCSVSFARGIMKRSLIAILSAASMCMPYSLSLYGPMTAERTIAVSPAFSVPLYPSVTVACSVRAGFGILGNFDIVGDIVSAGLYPAYYGGSWVMPRLHFGGGHIAALGVGVRTVSGARSFYCSPQYHWYGESGMLALGVNVSVDLYALQIQNPVFTAGIAPEFRMIRSNFHFFIEVTPVYTLSPSNSVTLSMAPGIWISVGEKPFHRFVVSFPINRVETIGTLPSAIGYEIRFRYATAFAL